MSVTVSTDGSSASFADTGNVITDASDAEMWRVVMPSGTGGVFRAQSSPGGFSDCACVEIKSATRMLVQTQQPFGGVVGIVDTRYPTSAMCKITPGGPARAYVLDGLVYIESPK